MQALLDHPDFPSRDLSSIRRLNNVAPPDVLAKFQAAMPQAVQTGAYGLTEAGGVIAFNHPDESLETRLRTCGQPMPGLEAKIVDPDSFDALPAGERGEIGCGAIASLMATTRRPRRIKRASLTAGFAQVICARLRTAVRFSSTDALKIC